MICTSGWGQRSWVNDELFLADDLNRVLGGGVSVMTDSFTGLTERGKKE